MDKPVEAIERMRAWVCSDSVLKDRDAILAYLDSLPEWPKELTQEKLEDLSSRCMPSQAAELQQALRALAAIAPSRKKRVVNLWQKGAEQTFADMECDESFAKAGWQKMNRAGPIELEY